jgi:hypothetical protein
MDMDDGCGTVGFYSLYVLQCRYEATALRFFCSKLGFRDGNGNGR